MNINDFEINFQIFKEQNIYSVYLYTYNDNLKNLLNKQSHKCVK